MFVCSYVLYICMAMCSIVSCKSPRVWQGTEILNITNFCNFIFMETCSMYCLPYSLYLHLLRGSDSQYSWRKSLDAFCNPLAFYRLALLNILDSLITVNILKQVAEWSSWNWKRYNSHFNGFWKYISNWQIETFFQPVLRLMMSHTVTTNFSQEIPRPDREKIAEMAICSEHSEVGVKFWRCRLSAFLV